MNMLYCCGNDKNETVVYEGSSAYGLLHTIRLKDTTKLSVYDSNLQLLHQPSFLNMPNTPLDYRNEVVTGIKLDEAQALSRRRTLSPLQQEFMSWHHRLYHLPYRILFRLSSLSFLPKQLIECRNQPPLCVACQFGQAHRRPWRTKGQKSGSIRRPEQTKPGDGVSVDQIVSAHPGLIP